MNLITQTLHVHTTNAITTITLTRPERKNAINFVMIDELISVAKRLKSDRHIRAVILTGSQGNFSSGMDVNELNNPTNLARLAVDFIKPTPSRFQEVCLMWQSLPMPVIALIDGVCLGAGLQLALGADFRVASPAARFGILESKWGLVADMGLSHTAKFVAPDVLKQLAMTANIIDASQAAKLGLTITTDDPTAWVQSLLDDISARSPDAVLASKRLINSMHKTSSWQLYQEKYLQLRLMMSHNRKLAIQKAKDQSVQFVKRQLG